MAWRRPSAERRCLQPNLTLEAVSNAMSEVIRSEQWPAQEPKDREAEGERVVDVTSHCRMTAPNPKAAIRDSVSSAAQAQRLHTLEVNASLPGTLSIATPLLLVPNAPK